MPTDIHKDGYPDQPIHESLLSPTSWLEIQGKLLVGDELTVVEKFIDKWQPQRDTKDKFIEELHALLIEVVNDEYDNTVLVR